MYAAKRHGGNRGGDLRRAPPRALPPAPRDRRSAQGRDAQRRARPVLPADRASPRQLGRGIRGTPSLAATRREHHRTHGLHPDRRGDRSDRPDRRLGDPPGVRATPVVEPRRHRSALDLGERVAAATPTRRRAPLDPRGARRDGGRPGPTDDRAHRVGARQRRGSPHGAARKGSADRACASRSTTSAPATRASPIYGNFPSTPSRSISPSSRRSSPIPPHRPCSPPSCTSRTSSTSK